MNAVRTVSLLAATVTTGLVAGLFYAYAMSVMPALRGVDDATFVDVMRRINTAILNGWFAVCFGGAPLLTALALALHPGGPAAVPTAAGLALYLVMLAVTAVVNVPANNRLLAAAQASADPGEIRAAFEARWVRANVVRAVTSTAAFGCLCWALLQY